MPDIDQIKTKFDRFQLIRIKFNMLGWLNIIFFNLLFEKYDKAYSWDESNKQNQLL